LLLKQSLQLRHVLQDDGYRNPARAHDGEYLVKIVGERNIGKFVHQEMDVNGERAAVFVVCGVKKLLEQLRVEYADEEIKRYIVIRQDHEQRGLFLAQCRQVKFVRHGQRSEAFKVELLQPCRQRDLNGFQRFARPGAVVVVILHRDVLRLAHFQTLKEFVQRALIQFILFSHVGGAQHFHHRREVPLVLRRFVVQIKHQRHQKHGRGRFPKRVLCLTAFRRRSLEKVRHKPLHVVVARQIHERIVAMAALHVDEVEDLHVHAACRQKPPGVPRDFSLRV
jgi:hypothetical protein